MYVLSIFIILLLTLIFANFSEALAEGRGKRKRMPYARHK